jgi:hypothetical protein
MQNDGVRHVSSLQSGFECSVMLKVMVTVVTLGLLSRVRLAENNLANCSTHKKKLTAWRPCSLINHFRWFSQFLERNDRTIYYIRPGLIHSTSVPLHHQYLSFYYTLLCPGVNSASENEYQGFLLG